MSQVLRLLHLVPQVVEDLERAGRRGPVPSELQLRRIAGECPTDQWAIYETLVARGDSRVSVQVRRPRRTGFDYDLVRARRLAELWDSGEYDSLIALGHAVGLTGSRVSQLIALLYLAPDILAVLDADASPPGVTKRAVRALARVRDHEEQRRQFREQWPGVLGEEEGHPT